MAELIPNLFTSWSMTDQEKLNGSILGELQTMCIQNEIVMYSSQKLKLELNPESGTSQFLEDAYLRGKIDALQDLLEESTASKAILYPNPQGNL